MDQHFAAFDKNERQQERIGRIVVLVIAALNLIAPAFNLIVNFEFSTVISLIIALVLSATLFFGVAWVRYLFAICAGIDAIRLLFLLLGGVTFTTDSTWFIFLIILQLVYSVTACLLLFFSKPVKEFLYRQKNG